MLRRSVREYLQHYNRERPHQGIDNNIPLGGPPGFHEVGPVKKASRLGGLLNFYYRDAA